MGDVKIEDLTSFEAFGEKDLHVHSSNTQPR